MVWNTINYAGHWSKGGKSSVYKFEYHTGTGAITSPIGSEKQTRVWFWNKNNRKLRYYWLHSKLSGSMKETSKSLAISGKGLNAYIVKNFPKQTFQEAW